jgi:hypothetical protein
MEASAGSSDGEVDFAITVPVSWGDGNADHIDWWNIRDGWQLLTDSPADDTFTGTVDRLLWGRSGTFMVRFVNDIGGTSASVSDTATPAGAAQTVELWANILGELYTDDSGELWVQYIEV